MGGSRIAPRSGVDTHGCTHRMGIVAPELMVRRMAGQHGLFVTEHLCARKATATRPQYLYPEYCAGQLPQLATGVVSRPWRGMRSGAFAACWVPSRPDRHVNTCSGDVPPAYRGGLRLIHPAAPSPCLIARPGLLHWPCRQCWVLSPRSTRYLFRRAAAVGGYPVSRCHRLLPRTLWGRIAPPARESQVGATPGGLGVVPP